MSTSANESTALLPEEGNAESEERADELGGEGPSTSRILLTLSGIYILAFLAALDSTLVATLAAPIADVFRSLPLLSWLASSYFIANTISQPLVGRLTDIYGRKAGILFAAVFFCLGNIICAVANSVTLIIFGRVVAGLGGGAMGPTATFVVGDLVPLRRRGLWQGSLNIFFGIGSSIGGPLGGLINDRIGWRLAFWLQFPPTVVAVILICVFLRLPARNSPLNDSSGHKSKLALVDFTGAFTLTTILTVFLLSINAGGNILPWSSPIVIIGLVLSVLAIPPFFFWETKHAFAIIPPRLLFNNSTVLSACLTNFLISLARFGLLFYGPIFFLVQGYSATQAGLRFVPESAAIAFTSIAAGFIMRLTGRYYALNLGLALLFTTAFAVILASFRDGLPVWLPFVSFFAVGVGYAGMLTTTLIAFNAAVSQEEQAVVTSTSYVFRSTGSAISVAIASALFQNVLRQQLEEQFGGSNGDRGLIHRLLESLDEVRELHGKAHRAAIFGYMQSLRAVWILLLAFAAMALIIAFFTKEHTLHNTLDRNDGAEEQSSFED